jgi:hypothetical protein
MVQNLKTLVAPRTGDANTRDILWKENFSLNIKDLENQSCRFYGFIAILDVESSIHSGFALFNRGKIFNAKGQKYKPGKIFGELGSSQNNSLFGEIHFEGNSIIDSKTKKFDPEIESQFIDQLKLFLDKEDGIGILEQAKKKSSNDLTSEFLKGQIAKLEAQIKVLKRQLSEIGK